ncbi:hypothetical protein [Streptomyces brasiliensis]|uniref:Uncharacterized protein n=1 Tax=Streptomyces brasiliensis TaxID=1954 RepID=A0A917L521_9ACTN|nr:hypothetical protein [Streptomyces brasiliensis]GGJ44853.1 hypothetical protein GCM10010121_065080 [Streptomyces brasiliensis]
MTDQPYEGGPYEGYDPYGQQRPQTPQTPQPWLGGGQHAGQGDSGGGHGQQGYGQNGYGQGGHPQAGQAQAGYPQATGHPQAGYPQNGHSEAWYPQGGQSQAAAYPQTGQPHASHAQSGHSHGAYPQPSHDQQQYTQQWQGQTWETQAHAAVPPAGDTTLLPPQQYDQPAPAQAHAPQATAQAAGTQEAGPAYGPATLAGNSRVTDAQRARLEGRSPIIEPGTQPAALTAVLGLLLSGTAAIGSYALVVPLVILQAVTAAGWFRLNGMWPARQGIALAFLGALTADVAVLVAGRDDAPAAILGPLGVWVLLALVLQLRSHADPDTRMYGLMATVASTALAVIATGYLGADPDAVTVGAAAVAVALLARALPLPTPASVVVALLAAAGAGIATGGMTDLGSKGALLGAAAAVCALVGHRVASYDYPSRFVHFTAGVALPLSAAAPVVWVLGRALG